MLGIEIKFLSSIEDKQALLALQNKIVVYLGLTNSILCEAFNS
jgi:hypothetical protein